AIDFDAEREAAHALRAATVNAAGAGLTGAPALDRNLGAGRGVAPEPGPTAGKRKQQDGQNEITQSRAAWGRSIVEHEPQKPAECGVYGPGRARLRRNRPPVRRTQIAGPCQLMPVRSSYLP